MNVEKMTTQELNAYKAHLSDHVRELREEILEIISLITEINIKLIDEKIRRRDE